MAVRGRSTTTLRSREHRALVRVLRAARIKARFRQTDLSERAGKYRTFINKVEKGERRLDVVEFIWVARALNVDPRKLIGRIL